MTPKKRLLSLPYPYLFLCFYVFLIFFQVSFHFTRYLISFEYLAKNLVLIRFSIRQCKPSFDASIINFDKPPKLLVLIAFKVCIKRVFSFGFIRKISANISTVGDTQMIKKYKLVFIFKYNAVFNHFITINATEIKSRISCGFVEFSTNLAI